MSDTEQQPGTTEQAPSQKTSHSSSTQGSCCKPHASLYISIIVLALAGYAAFNTTSHDNSAMQTQVDSLDHNVAGIHQQLEALNQAVQDNRDNLVQSKLKKALENIRDISGLAEEGSKAAISKVESMLQKLTTIGEQLVTPMSTPTTDPATVEPSTSDSPVESSSPTASSMPEPTTNNDAPDQASDATNTVPQAETTGTAIDTAVPPVSDKTSSNKTSSHPETATADSTTSPTVKPLPEIDHSAPQAF